MQKFTGTYFQWFRNELRGWSKMAWAIWTFGVGFQTSILITNPITWETLITYLATVVGLLCTCAMMEGRPINGLFGLVSVVGFVVVNLYAQHWWSVLDQLIFATAIDIPLMLRWRTWGEDFNAKVRKLDWQGWLLAGGSVLVAWLALTKVAYLLRDPQPKSDALVLSLGAVASVLCVLHYANTYTLWLAEDAVNIILWFVTLQAGFSDSALPMLVSTIMYTVTAVYGQWFSVWHKASQFEAGNGNEQGY